jgi:hypothetical protein
MAPSATTTPVDGDFGGHGARPGRAEAPSKTCEIDYEWVRSVGQAVAPCNTGGVRIEFDGARLLTRFRRFELLTSDWNVVGNVVLATAAIAARSVALAGFGLDSLIEIGASTVVLWELTGVAQNWPTRALRLIGAAFLALAGYLAVPTTGVLVVGYHPHRSLFDIVWTAVIAVVLVRPRRREAQDRSRHSVRNRHPGHRRPHWLGVERLARQVGADPRRPATSLFITGLWRLVGHSPIEATPPVRRSVRR